MREQEVYGEDYPGNVTGGDAMLHYGQDGQTVMNHIISVFFAR